MEQEGQLPHLYCSSWNSAGFWCMILSNGRVVVGRDCEDVWIANVGNAMKPAYVSRILRQPPRIL